MNDEIKELIDQLSYYDHIEETDVVSELITQIAIAREHEYSEEEVAEQLSELMVSLQANSVVENKDHIELLTRVVQRLPELIGG